MPFTVIDIETSGLKVTDTVNIIGIHTRKNKDDEGTYDHYKIPSQLRQFKEHAKRLMKDKHTLIYQNGKFDTKMMLMKLGVDLPIHEDTMYLSYITGTAYDLTEDRKRNGLKKIAMRELGVDDWDISLEDKTNADSAAMEDYLNGDLKYTMEVFFKLRAELEPEDYKTYRLIIMAANAYRDMEANGTPIDIPRVKRTLIEYQAQAAKVKEELVAIKDINWNSSKQLRELIYDDLGLPVYVYTEKGLPSTGKEAMTELMGMHPVVDKLLEHRRVTKAVQFLEDWIDREIDGRIYANVNLHTTLTGRTSCTEPNLQQVPRNKDLKKCFRSNWGWDFFQLDYSQMELRVAGTVANVESMIESYRNDEDLHTNMAKIISGKDEITKNERTQAKAANFGFLYGMSAKTFISYAKMGYGVILDIMESSGIRGAFFRQNRELMQYYKSIENELLRYGYITTLFGRRYKVGYKALTFPDLRFDFTRKAINASVQGAASDYALMALIEVHAKYKKDPRVRLCITVHDSLILEIKRCPEQHDIARDIQKIMERPKLLDHYIQIDEMPVPIKVDIEKGAWGAGEEI